MDISNWLTLFGIAVMLATHLSIISNRLGGLIQCVKEHERRINEIDDRHENCHLHVKMDEVEKNQQDLRSGDIPKINERLSRIEQELLDIKRRLEDIKNEMNRSGKRDRATD